MSLTSPLRKEVLIDFRLKISPNVEAVSLDLLSLHHWLLLCCACVSDSSEAALCLLILKVS